HKLRVTPDPGESAMRCSSPMALVATKAQRTDGVWVLAAALAVGLLALGCGVGGSDGVGVPAVDGLPGGLLAAIDPVPDPCAPLARAQGSYEAAGETLWASRSTVERSAERTVVALHHDGHADGPQDGQCV